MGRIACICLLAGLVLLAVTPAQCSIVYEIRDLGTLPGGTYSYATAINESGAVSGYSAHNAAGERHAVVWIGDSILELGDFGGKSSMAYAINKTGQMAGASAHTRDRYHAFLWTGYQMLDLGTLGGVLSEAYGINDAGFVVGYAADAQQVRRAVLWDGISITDLGTLGGASSTALDINNSDQVVGQAYTEHATIHAFLWSKGTMQDLGTLGGSFSRANGINDDGLVVGIARTAKGYDHAFLWDGKRMQDLGTLGGSRSEALAISGSGMVVGNAYTSLGARHAFWWDGEVMRDLNRLVPANSGWVLDSATSINSSGQIVGSGRCSGKRRAFLLTPINVIDVDIDIQTDDLTRKTAGSGMPVVVFSSPTFDVRTINPSTARFAGVSPSGWAIRDLNGDRLMDMVFQFQSSRLDLIASGAMVKLTGETYSGRHFAGTDTIPVRSSGHPVRPGRPSKR